VSIILIPDHPGVDPGKSYAGKKEWLFEDYRLRAREIEVRLGLRQALLNYSVLAFAGSGALLAFAKTHLPEWFGPLAYLAALLFLSLALAYVRHDLFIAYNARYIVQNILPYAQVDAVGEARVRRQCWEDFVGRQRKNGRATRLIHLLLAFCRFGPVLCVAATFLALETPSLVKGGLLVLGPASQIATWIKGTSVALLFISGILIFLFVAAVVVLLKEERHIAKAAAKLRGDSEDNTGRKPRIIRVLLRSGLALPCLAFSGFGIWALATHGFVWSALAATLCFLFVGAGVIELTRRHGIAAIANREHEA